jgi:hypothetical protein
VTLREDSKNTVEWLDTLDSYFQFSYDFIGYFLGTDVYAVRER